jgi:hypothetical protein
MDMSTDSSWRCSDNTSTQSTEIRKRSPLILPVGKTTSFRLLPRFVVGIVSHVALQDTPQQENFYDCGVFTCQFMEALSRGEDVFNFKQANMSYFRRRMVWEIAHTTLRDE